MLKKQYFIEFYSELQSEVFRLIVSANLIFVILTVAAVHACHRIIDQRILNFINSQIQDLCSDLERFFKK